MKKTLLTILIVLNAIVILGQIWPEGAPPFAGKVNLIFLFLNLLFLVYLILKKKI